MITFLIVVGVIWFVVSAFLVLALAAAAGRECPDREAKLVESADSCEVGNEAAHPESVPSVIAAPSRYPLPPKRILLPAT